MAMTDEEFAALRATARPYTLILLKSGPNRRLDGADQIVYRHGRRNVELRAVCPVRDGGELCGIGIFVYEVHPTRSFPGDALPG